MPLNIKDPVTEKLAAEVARLAGETKTGAIRRSLLERKERLALRVVRPDREAGLTIKKGAQQGGASFRLQLEHMSSSNRRSNRDDPQYTRLHAKVAIDIREVFTLTDPQ